jgi:hypothetical protein
MSGSSPCSFDELPEDKTVSRDSKVKIKIKIGRHIPMLGDVKKNTKGFADGLCTCATKAAAEKRKKDQGCIGEEVEATELTSNTNFGGDRARVERLW